MSRYDGCKIIKAFYSKFEFVYNRQLVVIDAIISLIFKPHLCLLKLPL